MLTIVGAIVVLGSVVGGYLLEHGKIEMLFQPVELLIIGGAALGSSLIAAPMTTLKAMIGQLMGTLKAKSLSPQEYTEYLMLLFELTKTAKANPLSLEPHVEKPETSDIFKRYPRVLANHHAIHFICDTLKVQISAAMNPYDLDDLMEADIASTHEEEALAPMTVGKMGDAAPGLGIVAAVMGVVITMGKLSQGKEVIGLSVAAALVGTFLGILMSYGFLEPLARKMESINAEAGVPLRMIKACLVAFAKDCSPKVCVEFARRTIPPHFRPSFEDVDKATSSAGKSAA